VVLDFAAMTRLGPLDVGPVDRMSPSNRSYATDEGFGIGAASWVLWEKQSVVRGRTLIFTCATSRSTI
jgi:hypothetical protein